MLEVVAVACARYEGIAGDGRIILAQPIEKVGLVRCERSHATRRHVEKMRGVGRGVGGAATETTALVGDHDADAIGP